MAWSRSLRSLLLRTLCPQTLVGESTLLQLTLATSRPSIVASFGTSYVAQFMSTYAINSWYVYSVTAPAGYQISNVRMNFASVEACCDYCIIRNALVSTWSSSTSVIASQQGLIGTVAWGPYSSTYGGVIQFDLFSDVSITSTGCRFTFGVSACPMGSYCPTGSSSPILCPAGTYGGSIGLSTSACSGTCPCCGQGATAFTGTCVVSGT